MASTITDPCAICLGDISRGQAIFTAECSHTFHHRCISDSVAHGNRDCPLCKATWRDVPAVDPVPAPIPPPRPAYADDEETVAQGVVQADAAATAGGLAAADAVDLVLKTHCEFSAVARDDARDDFAVLVHAMAPEASADDAARAPLDLVTVLDVSGSMDGNKLSLLKRAMRFVIDNLGPADRLSVVSFSSDATRKIRLTRMSDGGKASAKRAVESLAADGSTNIGSGLQVASDVLAHRRYRNAVTSVILLSDGRDNCSRVGTNYGDLAPMSIHFLHESVAVRTSIFWNTSRVPGENQSSICCCFPLRASPWSPSDGEGTMVSVERWRCLVSFYACLLFNMLEVEFVVEIDAVRFLGDRDYIR